jgi:hypothetical protein
MRSCCAPIHPFSVHMGTVWRQFVSAANLYLHMVYPPLSLCRQEMNTQIQYIKTTCAYTQDCSNCTTYTRLSMFISSSLFFTWPRFSGRRDSIFVSVWGWNRQELLKQSVTKPSLPISSTFSHSFFVYTARHHVVNAFINLSLCIDSPFFRLLKG